MYREHVRGERVRGEHVRRERVRGIPRALLGKAQPTERDSWFAY